MAKVQTLVGEKLLIQISDGAAVPTFAEDCLINGDRGIEFSSDVIDSVVPFCEDPSLPAWKEIFKDGMQASISGAGKLHTPSLEAWFNWVSTDTAKEIRVKVDVPGASGGGYMTGLFKLTQFNVTGARKNNTEIEATIVSHGPVTWNDNA